MSKNLYQEEEILVDVIMPTYNHEKFIVQAIQSVLMQECPFKYRLIIGEDCSTDDTLKICEQYAAAYTRQNIASLKTQPTRDGCQL